MEPAVSPKPTGRKAAALALKVRAGGAWSENKEAHGGFVAYSPRGRNRRTVWSIPTASFRPERVGVTDVDHFALFPPALVRPCVLAGTSAGGCCPECGCPFRRIADAEDVSLDISQQACACPPAPPVPCRVLDPFAGSCTTGVVCIEQSRDFVGLELNPDYARLGQARLDDAAKKKEARYAS